MSFRVDQNIVFKSNVEIIHAHTAHVPCTFSAWILFGKRVVLSVVRMMGEHQCTSVFKDECIQGSAVEGLFERPGLKSVAYVIK